MSFRCLVTLLAAIIAWPVGSVTLYGDEQLETLEERAFRNATVLAAPSIVRIQTVGGLDTVGSLLASTGPTTGVVVGEDGWIITSSFNFASKPASILVTTGDGLRHPATVIASDHARMLTLLKIDAGGLTPLQAVPVSDVAVGQWSIALGLTFDQPFPNVSVGIISAVGRVWGRALQTDAKISPANYGGPLVDVEGRGLGILVPLSPQESGETAGVEWYDSGIGFAIPLEDVYAVLDRLKSGEDLHPGLMGVGFADQSPIAGAAVIDRVRPGSPADEAGLEVGDTITRINDQPIARVPHLRHVLGRSYAGDEIAVTVTREEQEIATTVTLAKELTAYQRPLLGILPMRDGAEADAPAGAGVRFVLPGSPAEAAKVQRSDRIVAVNEAEIADAAQLASVISRHRPEDVLALSIVRERENIEVEVTLAKMSGEVPDSLPTSPIPPPAKQEAEPPATGRLVEKLGGDDERQFWAYVPSDYHSQFAWGLVVWLHPPVDAQEKETLAAWQSHCNRRGLILVAPKTANPSGWGPADLDFIHDLIEEFQERYTIDPARIVMHAPSASASMAAASVFRHRELFRGLSLIDSVLPVPPPQTDPDAPLAFHFSISEPSTPWDEISQIIDALRQLAFPVTVDRPEADADAADAVARWIDTLDRI